jgi:hypothetical protein
MEKVIGICSALAIPIGPPGPILLGPRAHAELRHDALWSVTIRSRRVVCGQWPHGVMSARC